MLEKPEMGDVGDVMAPEMGYDGDGGGGGGCGGGDAPGG